MAVAIGTERWVNQRPAVSPRLDLGSIHVNDPMAKLLKPTRANRAECVAALWQRLGVPDAVAASGNNDRASFGSYVQQGRVPQAGFMAVMMANTLLLQGLLARMEGRSGGDAFLRQAFAYVYGGSSLIIEHRRAAGWGVDIREDTLHELLAWQALAAGAGEGWFVRGVARHLHHLFSSGNVEKTAGFFAADPPARRFFGLLQQAIVDGRLPKDIDAKSLGPFAAILSTASDPAAFREALVDYCDYRVAECFGYHGIDADKRRRPSVIESFLDLGRWDQAYPVELLTLRFVLGLEGSSPPPMDAEHPLLHTKLFLTPWPALTPLHVDDVTRDMVALGTRTFGAAWPPFKPD